MSDKIKTLSQAIRLGATFRPQVRDDLFARVGDNLEMGSCALGAALEALGWTHSPSDGVAAPRLLVKWDWAMLLRERFALLTGEIHNEIVNRNNGREEWLGKPQTREQIADWLESIGL